MNSSLKVFLIFLMPTLVFFSCHQNSKNFSLNLPEGWTRMDTIFKNKTATILLPATDTMMLYNPIINITSSSIGLKSHNENMTNTKQYLFNSLNVQFLDEGTIYSEYGPCHWYSYTNKSVHPNREIIYYCLIDGNMGYNISAGVYTGGLEYYRDTFDEMVKSFRVR